MPDNGDGIAAGSALKLDVGDVRLNHLGELQGVFPPIRDKHLTGGND